MMAISLNLVHIVFWVLAFLATSCDLVYANESRLSSEDFPFVSPRADRAPTSPGLQPGTRRRPIGSADTAPIIMGNRHGPVFYPPSPTGPQPRPPWQPTPGGPLPAGAQRPGQPHIPPKNVSPPYKHRPMK
uniref:Putative proline-rich salivary protein n=1 Tax=Amblyomma triste TaxID=251400 RepID=A0A023G2D0_AMBTT